MSEIAAPNPNQLPLANPATISGVALPNVVHRPEADPLTELYHNYAPFAHEVQQLRRETADLQDRRAHPAHMGSPDSPIGIGSGYYADAYRLAATHPPLVAKLFKESDVTQRAAHVEKYARSLLRVKGNQSFVQVAAASPEDGALLSEELAGDALSDLSEDQLATVTREKIAKAIADLKDASEKGVILDPQPGNFLFGPQGFGFLDPEELQGDNEFAINVLHFARALKDAGWRRPDIAQTRDAELRSRLAGDLFDIIRTEYPHDERLAFYMWEIGDRSPLGDQ